MSRRTKEFNMTRECTECLEIKSISDFYEFLCDKGGKLYGPYRTSACIPCTSKRSRARQANSKKHPEAA